MKERLYNPMASHTLSSREVEKLRSIAPMEDFISSVYTSGEMLARKELLSEALEQIYTYYTTNTLNELEEEGCVGEDHVAVVLPEGV